MVFPGVLEHDDVYTFLNCWLRIFFFLKRRCVLILSELYVSYQREATSFFFSWRGWHEKDAGRENCWLDYLNAYVKTKCLLCTRQPENPGFLCGPTGFHWYLVSFYCYWIQSVWCKYLTSDTSKTLLVVIRAYILLYVGKWCLYYLAETAKMVHRINMVWSLNVIWLQFIELIF